MYKYDQLTKYEYFKQFEYQHLLDSLTGVVARAYILGFANELIEKNIPFSMAILDIDNFKLINDNYGHYVGDEILETVSSSLIKCVGDKGLVGRFGGDEFIILYLKPASYDEVYSFLKGLCGPDRAVRRTYVLDAIHTFVTGTIGCASFPGDAVTYDDLFMKVDKALYRGKSKGRNCFIIYVDSKHKDIDVHKKDKMPLSSVFSDLSNIGNERIEKAKRVKQIADYIYNNLNASEVLLVKNDSKAISSNKKELVDLGTGFYEELDSFLEKDNYKTLSSLIEIKEQNPEIKKYLKATHTLAVAISRITRKGENIGFLIMTEDKIKRIWQENDIAIMMYASLVITSLDE